MVLAHLGMFTWMVLFMTFVFHGYGSIGPLPFHASAEPMLPASIGLIRAQFWHMHDMSAMSRFTIIYCRTYPVMIAFLTMVSLIIISIFKWWSGRPHALIHCLYWMVLGWFVFHYWPCKCIESHSLHEILVHVFRTFFACAPGTSLNSQFTFKPVMIRL